ncbi:MAG: DUF2314 domain-containing protein [Betaproteobacteria bacterium]
MNLLLRTLLISLALCGTCGELQAVGAPTTVVSNGPPVATRIRFEFAVYYPDHPAATPMTALRQRIAADAHMPQWVKEVSETTAGPAVSGRWIAHARKDYTPASASMLKRFGHGLSAAQVDALSQADEAFVMDFAHAGGARMNALRNAQLLVEQVARDTHGLVWDDETREAFTPDAWHERRVLGWAGDVPDVEKHTTIHMYRADALYRCITLGMAKFGEPDVIVDNLVASDSRPIGNLINVVTQALVEGSVADARGELELRLQQSRHPAVNQAQGEGLKASAARSARLLLVPGHWEEGDPHNRLVRIAFDRYAGPDEHARQAALTAGLYGSEDAVTRIHHDGRLLAARDAARAHLPQLRDTFARGLSPGEYIQVKAPFATDSGGREWMWVEVSAWKGDRIDGTLQNTPDDVKHLHSGQDVTVSQADLFDYLFHHADGHDEGNTTGAVIEEQAR